MKRMFCFAALIIVSLSCLASAFENEPIGWVTMSDGNVPYTITGGAAGAVVVATNETTFKTYVQSTTPYIILVPKMIMMTRGAQTISMQSNKTIIGTARFSGINGGLNISGKNNIIIRNINIWYEDASQGSDNPSTDGITIQSGSHHIWVDHCTIYNSPDGLIDTSSASSYVTISWCRFYYTEDAENTNHHFTNLVGSSDTATSDRGKLKVTYHHNWWAERCRERMPRVRFGRVHVYNNYYSCNNNGYCAGVGNESQIMLENNYYDNVKEPWKDYYSGSGTPGKIGWNGGNVFVTTTIPTWAPNDYNNIFVPPYPYTLDDGNDVKDMVMAGAGAGYCYGDFNRNNIINSNDFAILAGYWLEHDCSLLAGIDYNCDCNINYDELGFFVENWLYALFDTTPPAAPTGLSAVGGVSTVSLNWNDNGEPDIAGYNVYRAAASPSGFVKINSSLISSSDYTDNSVVNGTIYYYAVRAVDTSENESIYSNKTTAIPFAPGTLIIQESTPGFCSTNGSVSTLYAGYTGIGFIYAPYVIGKYIDWNITVPSAATYNIKWRYALLSGTRPAKLLVNGSEAVSSISFPVTGAWTTWTIGASVNVPLDTGTNNIHLEATSSNGLANIDYIVITGTNPQPASCP